MPAQRKISSKSITPKKSSQQEQGFHLVGWVIIWFMFASSLLVSISFLYRVDWKWLTEYAYMSTHRVELEEELVLRALERSTCDAAAKAMAASTSTCQALGFTKTTSTTTTSSTR